MYSFSNPRNKEILFSLLLLLLVSGCDLFGGNDDPEEGFVEVTFEHYANDQPVMLDQSTHSSDAGHSFTITLLEYIVTDLALTHEDGAVTTLKASHYINKDNPETSNVSSGALAPGKYTSVSFRFGIEGSQNVFGTLERTTSLDNMVWPMMMPMGDGSTERYHYMRFEGRYGSDGTFRIHNGPSGGGDYSFSVSLPIDLEIDGNTTNLQIDMHLEQWLTVPNVWDFDDYGMIMGNPSAQALIQANGATVFHIND